MIYVTGANGQLGSELKRKLGNEAIFLNREQLDLSDLVGVEEFLKNTKIDLLLNAGAYTQVDKAESEIELALAVNANVPRLMARYANKKKFKLIHFSTDYVFNGEGFRPYTEEAPVNPVNFYGMTKLEGERGVLEESPSSVVIRTSWVYSTFGKNFIKTILKFGAEREQLNVVYDQVGTLTYAADLAEVALKSKDLQGVFHFSNEGVSSWYDVAFELKKTKKFKADINPILSHQYPTPAKRPHYSVLDKAKIKNALGIKIPHWTESLRLCLQELS